MRLVPVTTFLIWVVADLGVLGRTTHPSQAAIFSISPEKSEGNSLDIVIRDSLQVVKAVGKLGLSFPSAIGSWTYCSDDQSCIEWGDFARISITEGKAPGCSHVEWSSTYATEIEDCYDLQPGVHWYGGGETYIQTWPIENNARRLSPYVVGDFLANPDEFYGGVAENYWLLSNGAALVIDPTTPLHFSLNTTRPDKVCFIAKKSGYPYQAREILTMKYDWCLGSNLKEAHQLVMKTFFDKPEGIPDETMIMRPFWSTWAEYKTNVNQTIVLDYARRLVSEGFGNSSHVEIDDNWETCYGQAEFDSVKFPDPKAMTDEIKAMGMRVTAWIHPFVNYDCPLFNEGMKSKHFVQNSKPRVGITAWWEGENTGLVDMTNPDAREWYLAKLRKLQETAGINSFKFDAGETTWLPADTILNDQTDPNLWPQLFTTKYVETAAQLGGLIETRTAKLNQKQAIFIRMLDKASRWGYDNGLRSMIPTLLHMSLVGYPFVLPDMIGGNAFNDEWANKEMFIRWLQLNIFMPALQFSLVPWAYDRETIDITLNILAQREKFRDDILSAARQTTIDGSPMNRPIWWVDPDDKETFTIDDAYMLGDRIMVAPVVYEGSTSRNVYLPRGSWTDQNGITYQGPQWLNNYPAPLNVVPIFIKQ